MAKSPTTTKSSEAVIATIFAGTAEGALSAASETTARTEKMSLAEALASLDPNDDSNWTADGKPRMEVLESLTGGNLTREDVENEASGFTRETAATPLDAGGPNDAGPLPTEEQQTDTRTVESRLDELEADSAFLRKQFGWPKRSA